jgi:hypothetical protein
MSNVGKGTLIKSSVVCVMGKCRTLIRYVRRLPESPVFSVTPGCVPLPTFRLARYSCIFRVTDAVVGSGDTSLLHDFEVCWG